MVWSDLRITVKLITYSSYIKNTTCYSKCQMIIQWNHTHSRKTAKYTKKKEFVQLIFFILSCREADISSSQYKKKTLANLYTWLTFKPLYFQIGVSCIYKLKIS